MAMTTDRKTMSVRFGVSLAAICGVLTLGSGALAQDGDALWNDLEIIDQGTEDFGPLSESLRLVPVDPRVSDGFENVYRLESGLYARREGSLTAVFPRSAYVPTRFGVVPVIPAGTYFLIGTPSSDTLSWLGQEGGAPRMSEPSPAARAQRVNLRADQAPAAVVEPESWSAPANPTPWRSERERGWRVSTLLTAAAGS